MFGKKRASQSAAKETRQLEVPPPSAFEIDASVQTDKGCVREINEDSGLMVRPSDPAKLAAKGTLLVVADGMGGHSAGEVASQMAADVVTRLYYELPSEPGAALKTAVEEANRQIHEEAAADEAKHGMGTTCTALALCGGRAYAAHVGDSRLYMLRAGKLYQLSEDHSAVNEMVKLGIITKEQARTHEDKNVILRALGTTPEVEVSVLEPFAVREGEGARRARQHHGGHHPDHARGDGGGRGTGRAHDARGGGIMIGQVFGNYKITQKLGEGGMGEVFRGVDMMLEREVAIKFLRPELASQPQVVERFRSEAVTLAKLQ